ncbi:MAG TPA: alpha-L-fucosidase [Clostridia bacterium]|nr:alpha-L-fucosidase [Clostridia bacterium]
MASTAWGRKPALSPATEKALQSWREARFGMFIHWGLYAVPAGEWKGREVPGIGEWIMNRAKIPVSEYEALAPQFNPTKFNAEEWVRIAKQAGVKYIVITSKHHDGFAIFKSDASKFNIVDATPFRRDPLKELAAACQKAGIKLGFYYSQTQDWHEPNGFGNDWDFKEPSKEAFSAYLEAKVKPQVRELLTNYGPISLIWFDTPKIMDKEQSQDLANFVHKLQPSCLVSGRVGNGVGDYDSTGDNQITVGVVKKDWEAPVTMNHTWGFKKNDSDWKPVPVLVRQLVRTVSGGGNYLLNVGPDATGVIPAPSVERLAEVGKWLSVNGESIYGAGGSIFRYEQDFGLITSKPGKLYLHLFDWRNEIVLNGLQNKVKKAYLLANKRNLNVTKRTDGSLHVALPSSAPDAIDSVVVLEIDGAPKVERAVVQQPNGQLALPAFLGEVHKTASGPGLRFDSRGVVERWTNTGEWMSWKVRVSRPGEFEVQLLSSEQKYGKAWEGGHKVGVEVAGQQVAGTVNRDNVEQDPTSPYWKHVVSNIGRVKIDKAGQYTLNLMPEKIEAAQNLGLTLVSVKLVPVK